MPGFNSISFWFDFPLDSAEEKKKRIDAFLSLRGLCPAHLKKPELQATDDSLEKEPGRRRVSYKCCCESHTENMKNLFIGLISDKQI